MDLIDKKILTELDKNSRIPSTKLAKKLRTSPQKIKYRIENLKKKGIIREFLTITEYKKAGYTNYIIYLRLQNLTKKKEVGFFNYLEKHKNVNVVMRFNAVFDVSFSILAKSIFELNKIMMEINNKFSDIIKEKDVATHIGAYKFDRNYLLERKNEAPLISTGKREEILKLDKTDLELISLLNKNSRMTSVEIASKMGISVDSIIYRRKKLEKEKIILGYTILLNNEKIGFSYYRFLLKLKNISDNKEKEFLDFCAANKNVVYFVKTFGNWEATIDIEIEHKKIRNFVDEINKKFSEIIQDYEVLEVFDISKFRYFIEI